MRVGRAMILDCIQIEETGGGDAFFFEDAAACSALRIVGEEPCGAERDHTRGCGDLGGDILGQGGGEIFRCDNVGFEVELTGSSSTHVSAWSNGNRETGLGER